MYLHIYRYILTQMPYNYTRKKEKYKFYDNNLWHKFYDLKNFNLVFKSTAWIYLLTGFFTQIFNKF